MKWIGKHNIFDDLMIGGVLLTPPDPTYEYELTLPNNDGSSGQVLTTDGNGLLTWTTVATGSGVTMTNGVNDRVMTATGAASITGDSALTFDNTGELLTIGDAKIRGKQYAYNSSLVSSYIELPSVNAFGSGLGAVFKVADTTGTCSGAGLWIEGGDANGTNQAGGNMHFKLGTATGSGANGVFEFLGGSGSLIAKIYDTGLRLPVADQAIVFEGGSYDTTLKAQTSVGADRTITLPNATGTVALTSDIPALSVPVTIGQGGTGQTTQQAAIDALTAVSGASTSDVLRKDGSGNATWAALPSNVTLNGTTAGGIATYASANTLDIESTLTYSPNTLTIGDTTNSSIEIITPLNGPAVRGSVWNFTNGNAGGGTNNRPGQIVFNSGMGTGDTTAGIYTFMGGPMNNPSGGTGYSSPTTLASIYGDNGAANSTILKLQDLNSTRDFFDITVTTDAKTTFRNIKGSAGGGSPDMLIDCHGKLELNADGGSINFFTTSSTAQLARIDTDGLSFRDNINAGIKFEGATDNGFQTTLSVIDPTATRSIDLPDDDGTVALQDKGYTQNVVLPIPSSYQFYLYYYNSWFTAMTTTLRFLGSSAHADFTFTGANAEYVARMSSFVATRACKLKKLIWSGYASYGVTSITSANMEYGFFKVPITDGGTSAVTVNSITATNNNFTCGEFIQHQKTFVFSGSNATLAEGDGFSWCMRANDGTSSTTTQLRGFIYGQGTLEIEYI